MRTASAARAGITRRRADQMALTGRGTLNVTVELIHAIFLSAAYRPWRAGMLMAAARHGIAGRPGTSTSIVRSQANRYRLVLGSMNL